MNKSHLVLATSIGLVLAAACGGSTNSPSSGEDSGVPGADGSGSGGSSGSGSSSGSTDAGPGMMGADAGTNGCQCAASEVCCVGGRRTGWRSPLVLMRGRQRVPRGVSGRSVHQRAGLRRRTAVLLSAQREHAKHDECERVHGVLSGGSAADVHDGRRLPDGRDVRDAIGRRLRFHDLPRDTSLHGDGRLRDGPGVLRRCGRRRERLPVGHELRSRDGPGVLARRLRRGSGLLQRRRGRRRLEHLQRGHFVSKRRDSPLRGVERMHRGNGVLRGRRPDMPDAVRMRRAGESTGLRHQHRLPCCVPRLPQHDVPCRSRRRCARRRRRSGGCRRGGLTRRRAVTAAVSHFRPFGRMWHA